MAIAGFEKEIIHTYEFKSALINLVYCQNGTNNSFFMILEKNHTTLREHHTFP